MDTIHECRIVSHFGWHGTQEMANLLLLFDIYVEIANHDDATLSADVFFAAAELARGHIAFHDVDAVLLVEGDAGDFVKTYDIILADQTALATGVIYEHLRHGRLAARDQVPAGRCGSFRCRAGQAQ